MRFAIPALALGLVACASSAFAVDGLKIFCSTAPSPLVCSDSPDKVTRIVANATVVEMLTSATVEKELMALGQSSVSPPQCSATHKVTVFVSNCFTTPEVAEITRGLDSALAASSLSTFANGVTVQKSYDVIQWGSCTLLNLQFPTDLSILKVAAGWTSSDSYVFILDQSSPTPPDPTVSVIRVCPSSSTCVQHSSDIITASTAGVASFAQPIENHAKCGTIPGSQPFTFTVGGKKECKCQCPADRPLANGVCSCGGGTISSLGACDCPVGLVISNGQCRCPGGQVLDQGICKCPTGLHLDIASNVCVPDCFWQGNSALEGVQCFWAEDDKGKSSLKLKDDCSVIAPVPNDNYVNDLRSNKYDTALALLDPTITIASQYHGSTKIPKTTTWYQYAMSPGTLENQVTLDAFGLYDLSMVATDYRGSATCLGCVAVVDTFGPVAKTACQTLTAAASVDYSTSALTEVRNKETEFTGFYADTNIDNNDAGATSPHANERDDVTSAEVQHFFSLLKTPLNSLDDKCFTVNYVAELLTAALLESANVPSLATTSPDQMTCEKCCSKSSQLGEKYFDYSCSGVSPLLTRTTDSCSYNQCLRMPAATLVVASASTTEGSNTKTEASRLGLNPPPPPDPKVIHRSIPCTTFTGPNCAVTTTLASLFDRTVNWGPQVAVPTAFAGRANEFVHWRYKVDTDSSSAWVDTQPLTFAKATTTVYVEAWTRCGLAYEDSFVVHVHPHTPRDVCTNFVSRWTENSPSPRTVDTSYMCTYPQSDFLLLTFNYDSTDDVVANGVAEVKGKYTSAECTVKLAEAGELASASPVTIPLAITPDADGKFTIDKQVALELVRKPTAKNTDAKIECRFTFSYHASAETTSVVDGPCEYDFSITDCDRPTVVKNGEEGVCALGKCMQSDGVPGPYEACGGDVFWADEATTTKKVTTDTCCTDCEKATLACSTVTGQSVKRCDVAIAPPLMMALAMETSDVVELAQTTSSARGVEVSTTTAMAGVSALVAVVALVVVKVRAARVNVVVDDAYVSLLD